MAKILKNKNDTTRRNCFNCKWLEWVDGDTSDPSGFICNDREYLNDEKETDHLALLMSNGYLNCPKCCCSLEEDKQVY